MDHSVLGYLRRQPTDVLRVLLRSYAFSDKEYDQEIADLILTVLAERYFLTKDTNSSGNAP